MMCRRPVPMIGKLSELLVSGKRAAPQDTVTTPRSPLDLDLRNLPSPRSFKSSYEVGGDGLGIVMALDKSIGAEVLLKCAARCSSNLNRSNPIPVRRSDELDRGFQGFARNLENYRSVTHHVPEKRTAKVHRAVGGVESDGDGPRPRAKSSFPTLDFLSSCHWCGKNLHGKDIFMYRGEDAFCSCECRSHQMMLDERKEQCRSEPSMSAEPSSSPSARDQIFSTGILVI